jgi:pimeloyl-ACP methyl ester carboxylesterase
MREPSRADPRVEPIKIAGPPGARPLLLSYPWTPGNAAYIAALGGPAEAASRRNASELIRGLARTRRTVLFEYPPGVTGDNDPPPELPIGDVAGDVLAVADAVGADTFELLGYSWSASVAI